LAGAEGVPKRLILGKNAGGYVKRVEGARMEEAAKYRDLALSMGFTGLPK